MTTTQDHSTAPTSSRFAAANALLDGLAAQDFTRVGDALGAEVRLRALLPPGQFEWTGADVIAGQFAHWFGDTTSFELVEGTADEIGGRLHLRWRLRLQAERLGDGSFVVEQQAYADTDEAGRIGRLDLLCTGYRPENGQALG
jgi:hypothetical protein